MKKLILGLTFLLSGCGTSSILRRAMPFMSDPDVPAAEKREYLETIETLQTQTEAMQIYHYTAIVCFAIGAFIIFIKRGNTLLGFGAIFLGVALSGWAMYAPSHAEQIGWGLLAVLVLGGTYLAYILLATARDRFKK